ncbi:hypothetical protein Tco_1010547 [Tanacetum coccineum]
MVGSLMYLTASRPDLVFAVCMCARYQAKPTKKHLEANHKMRSCGMSGFREEYVGSAQFLGGIDVTGSWREKELRNQIFRALTASADVPSSVTETTNTTSTLPPPLPPLQKPIGHRDIWEKVKVRNSNAIIVEASEILATNNRSWKTSCVTEGIHNEDGNPARAYIKQALGSFKDGDRDGDTHYERSHKGVKASANSDIIFFFTSAQDGNKLLDDERLSLADDLKKAHDQNQNKSK